MAMEWAVFASDGLVGCAVIAAVFALGWALGSRSGEAGASLS